MSKPISAIFVDVGYNEITSIVVIKNNAIREQFTLVPQTEFADVVAKVVAFARQYEITDVRAYGHPTLEHAVGQALWRNPAKENIRG